MSPQSGSRFKDSRFLCCRSGVAAFSSNISIRNLFDLVLNFCLFSGVNKQTWTWTRIRRHLILQMASKSWHFISSAKPRWSSWGRPWSWERPRGLNLKFLALALKLKFLTLASKPNNSSKVSLSPWGQLYFFDWLKSKTTKQKTI